jgi:hypothetical protein
MSAKRRNRRAVNVSAKPFIALPVGAALGTPRKEMPQGVAADSLREVPAVSEHRGELPWLVGQVEAYRRALNCADGHLRESVEVARMAGATWDDIGDALGVTRQSASRKYGA